MGVPDNASTGHTVTPDETVTRALMQQSQHTCTTGPGPGPARQTHKAQDSRKLCQDQHFYVHSQNPAVVASSPRTGCTWYKQSSCRAVCSCRQLQHITVAGLQV